MTSARVLSLPDRPSAVLFDLDGTISESGTVIVATLRETLQQLGLGELPEDAAKAVVGPPLGHTLQHILGVDPDLIPTVITHYRALLREKLAQTPPYDGMIDLIRELAAAGVPLAVATSKVESMAEQVIAFYQLSESFVAVCGSGADEMTSTKATVVAAALARLHAADADTSAAVMVGDRHHDIDGAAAHGVPTIAVTWGYGNEQEWSTAAATVTTPEELRALLLP